MKAFAHRCAEQILLGLLCFLAAGDLFAQQSGGTLYTKHAGMFTAVSDDQNHTVSLINNLQNIHSWICTRWGLPSKQLSLECRVFCMTSADVLKSKFRLSAPVVECQQDENGKWVYAMFIVADDSYVNILPFFFTKVILKDMERQYNIRFGHWLYRGMGTLNCGYTRIREKMWMARLKIQKDDGIYFSRAIFTMTEADWAKQSPELQMTYDAEAAAMCLLLFKESGKGKFLEFMGSQYTPQDMQRVFGISSYDVLDPVFKKYLVRVSAASSNKYLEIP